MSIIKPIETVYRGHRFRSRLEARWAVFFTELGIEYLYEPEGFELGDGVRYLPDFFLPSMAVHVEVKPTREISQTDLEKIVRFASDGGKPLLLLVGSPGDAITARLLDRTCLDSWSMLKASAESDDELLIQFWESIDEWSAVRFGPIPRLKGWHLVYLRDPPNDGAAISTALAKAKGARFEFGRSGN